MERDPDRDPESAADPDSPAGPASATATWAALFERAAAADVSLEAVADALAEVRDGGRRS